MSVGGSGIPRLQDISYIEVAVGQVAAGANFDQIRRAVISRAAETARDSDTDGSFDELRWEAALAKPTEHVHNAVDVLKELMRLRWLERHILPSGPGSAYLHAEATFNLTEAGQEWAELARRDRRAAYNALVGVLMDAHPQFEGYLRAVGARPDSRGTHMTIPLLRWDSVRDAHEDEYLNSMVQYAAAAVESGKVGWTADRATIDAGVRSYVGRIRARMQARGKPVTRKQFVNTCEEAITRVAFAAVDCPLDYVSMELLRRWMRFLGIANFSYYAPGPYALRLWSTGTVAGRGDGATISRRVGPQVRREALDGLLKAWQEMRAEPGGSSMYLPIWELRAAVCWQKRINDDEFDKAIVEALNGSHGDLGFAIHLDQASMRATPGSTRPLVLPTASGLRRVFNVISVMPAATSSKEMS
jgi:hypothetical protein